MIQVIPVMFGVQELGSTSNGGLIRRPDLVQPLPTTHLNPFQMVPRVPGGGYEEPFERGSPWASGVCTPELPRPG